MIRFGICERASQFGGDATANASSQLIRLQDDLIGEFVDRELLQAHSHAGVVVRQLEQRIQNRVNDRRAVERRIEALERRLKDPTADKTGIRNDMKERSSRLIELEEEQSKLEVERAKAQKVEAELAAKVEEAKEKALALP